jgi:CheY-like chemotaxis protein
MFHLKRGQRTKSARARSVPEAITVLAITQSAEDAAALRGISAACGWKFRVVESSGAAIPLLKEQPAPVVICDRDLAGEDWRDVLARIAAMPVAVCVLVASRVVDDSLRQQVIQHYGYDVISKPFQPETVRHAVTFAWSWRGWTYRRQSGGLPAPPA